MSYVTYDYEVFTVHKYSRDLKLVEDIAVEEADIFRPFKVSNCVIKTWPGTESVSRNIPMLH